MKKLRSVIVATAVSISLLAAVGCAESGNKPYSLTGDQSLTPQQQHWVDRQSIDVKNHYNPVLHQQALNEIRLANQSAQ